MRIFAAGIATETNTFAAFPTGLADFAVQRGRDVLSGHIEHPGLDLSCTWGRQARSIGAEFHFGLMAYAQPAGVTVRRAYELLRDELLAELRAAAPVDVVLLNLHGAMIAEGYDDCEEDLVRRARDTVGPEAVVGVLLDLHCHLNESTIAQADVVITFKEFPHVDVNDRAREVFELAVRAKLGEIRPTMALFDCRMIGIYPTTREPLRAFVDAVVDAEQRQDVLSISFAHGYPFADVPHVGAKVLAITNAAPELAKQVAEEFGMRIYAMRRDIGFDNVSLGLESALRKAVASRKTPVVVADQSDNPGGGAPGDSTFALQWLVENRAENVALATFYDPQVVRIAKMAGEGARLAVRLGGKLGPLSGDPIDLEVLVLSVRENYLHVFPQQSGDPELYQLGDVVALRSGNLDIVASSERCQCFSPSIFSDLGIDPRQKQLLVVKSTQHFYAAFAPLAGEVIYMAAPGAVAPDPRQIPYRRVSTAGLFPWAPDPLSASRRAEEPTEKANVDAN